MGACVEWTVGSWVRGFVGLVGSGFEARFGLFAHGVRLQAGHAASVADAVPPEEARCNSDHWTTEATHCIRVQRSGEGSVLSHHIPAAIPYLSGRPSAVSRC